MTTRRFLLRTRILAGAACVALAATACVSPDPEGTAEGEWTVRIALATESANMDAQFTNDAFTSVVHYNNVSESLTRRTSQGEVEPALATKWTQTDPLTWTFELAEGVTFHNGEPFDATAAAYSVNRIALGEIKATHAGFFTEIEKAEPGPDAKTLLVRTKTPAPELPSKLIFAPMVPPKLAQSAPDALSKELVGTGPYKVTSATQDKVEMVKNDKYWGGTVQGPDRVVVAIRPETSARLAALQANEFDIVDNVPANLQAQAPQIIGTNSIGRVQMIILNAYRDAFSDPKVREAFVKAVDTNSLRTTLFPEPASLADSCQLGSPGAFGFSDALPRQTYDPAGAKRLLAEAGKVGTKIVLIAPPQWPQVDAELQVIIEQAKAAGFDIQRDQMDYTAYLKQVTSDRAGRADAILINASSDSGTVSQAFRTYLLEASMVSAFPQTEYPDLQGKVAAAMADTDEAARTAAYNEINQTVCQSNAFLFVQVPNILYGVSDTLTFPSRADWQLPFTEITRK